MKADGSAVLLNDTANGGLNAYRVGVAPNRPTTSFAAARVSAGQLEISWTEPGVVLQESTNLVSWTDLPTATSPHPPTIGTRSAACYRLTK